MPATEAKLLVEQISLVLERARASIAAGETIVLTGLDDQVRGLCEGVLKLPPQEAAEYRAHLDRINHELTELRDALKKVQDEVRSEINTLNRHQKAAKAYQAPVAPKPEKKGE